MQTRPRIGARLAVQQDMAGVGQAAGPAVAVADAERGVHAAACRDGVGAAIGDGRAARQRAAEQYARLEGQHGARGSPASANIPGAGSMPYSSRPGRIRP